MICDELGCPPVLHPVLQIAIVHHRRRLRKPESLAAQFELFFALAAEAFRVAVGKAEKVQLVLSSQTDNRRLEKPGKWQKIDTQLVRHAIIFKKNEL